MHIFTAWVSFYFILICLLFFRFFLPVKSQIGIAGNHCTKMSRHNKHFQGELKTEHAYPDVISQGFVMMPIFIKQCVNYTPGTGPRGIVATLQFNVADEQFFTCNIRVFNENNVIL